MTRSDAAMPTMGERRSVGTTPLGVTVVDEDELLALSVTSEGEDPSVIKT